MHPILQRTLMAYRPLCLRGLLMDGQYRWPKPDQPASPAKRAGRTRQRTVLAALTPIVFHHRSKS